jgi:hypothetical protein
VSSKTDELPRGGLFEVLSSDRRRYLIYFLQASGGEADLRDLARLIAARENGTDPEDISDKEQKRVYISLYQSHVPKLEDYDLVEYDSEKKRVIATDRITEVTKLFEEPSRPWERYYIALALGSALLVLLHLLGIGILSISGLTALIVVALLGLSVAHYYVESIASSGEPSSELL